MPTKDIESLEAITLPIVLCRRCNISEAILRIRADQVCEKCFILYVTTKAIKRMETYKVRGPTTKAPKRLLLPISLGPSSTSLLYILNNQLQSQHDRMGRTSYELVLVHVFLEFDDVLASERSIVLLDRVRERFPSHELIVANLKDAMTLDSIDWTALGLSNPLSGNLSTVAANGLLEEFLRSITANTSRVDIVSTLLTLLLVDTAKKSKCESILFGDSTTRLAGKTLTETAKGRGFSLPWQVADGVSPYGVNFFYPLRDLLKKEILVFSSLATPPLNDLIISQPTSSQASASVKSTTIDSLMAQYFDSVEENYPSIVANVVRTSSKLRASASSPETMSCGLCGLPIADGTGGIHGWGGDQNSHTSLSSIEVSHHGLLCYGCSRSLEGSKPGF